MIMALLIDLLLRGGKFFTLAARRTLWQMFENNECGPRILLDHENLLKLVRTTESIKFGKDKDIQTSGEVICLRKEYVRYASVGDNHTVKPQPKDAEELKKLEGEVDGALKNLQEALQKKQSDASLERVLDELERKVREVDTNEPVLLPVFMPQKIASKGDSFSSLQGCISKFRVEEREVYEPILQSKPAKGSKYLKSSISDDLHIKFGKSRKYFKRITEHFSVNNNHTHNSLPDLTTPTTLSFYSCRSLHTNSRHAATGTMWKNPREKYVNLQDAAIREMLDRKIKSLAEKRDKRKKKDINRSEVKERERLLEINQKAFKKVEDDLKTVKIIDKHASGRQSVDVDELLSLLDDSPKINFLKNMKIHKEVVSYEHTTASEFIVPMISNESVDIKKSAPKLNLSKLQEEIKANCKESDCNVRTLVQFMKYEEIPRIYHLNETTLGHAISTELMGYVASKRAPNVLLQINKEWEKLNQMELQEEIIMRSSPLLKFTLPNSYENTRTMDTIEENVELEIAAAESKTRVLEMGIKDDRTEESVIKLGAKVGNVMEEGGKEVKTAEKVETSTETEVQTPVLEQQKKVFKRRMKARKNEEMKTKEAGKVLIRPTNVKRLGRKGPKLKKLEETIVANAESVMQDKTVAEILEIKENVTQDFKIFQMDSLVVEEKTVDEHKAIEEVEQQVEGIVKNVETAKNTELKPKALAVDKKTKSQMVEAVAQKEAVDKKMEINETIECSGEDEQVMKTEVLAIDVKDTEIVTKTQVLEKQEQLQSEANIDGEKDKFCGKLVVEEGMEIAGDKTIPILQDATQKETSQKSVASAEDSALCAPEKPQTEPIMQLKVSSTKLEMGQEPAKNMPVEQKVTQSKEKVQVNESDYEKIKTDLSPNSLSGSSIGKSRIPVRRTPGECTEAMEVANKTIQRIASQYEIEKRNTLILKGCSVPRKKLRPLQRIGIKVFKPNKTSMKKEVKTAADASVHLRKKQSVVVREAKDSASDVFKKLLNKNSSELKVEGNLEVDVNIENEMPPDFDVLKEVDLVDIPIDDDERLEVPAETKHTVVPSEKSLEGIKYCSDVNKEKELVELLLDGQNLGESAPKESDLKPCLKQQKQRKRSIQAIKGKETDECTNASDIKRNIHNSNTHSHSRMPKYTFWNRQPKAEENSDANRKEKEEQSKTKQEGTTGQQKKYKMVTDEIEAIGGGKIKVTKLVEDI